MVGNRENIRANQESEQPSDSNELGAIAHERKEAVRVSLEKAERERKDIHESEREILADVHKLTDNNHDDDKNHSSPAEKRQGPINKKQLDSSFKSQMSHIRTELNPAERIASKLIHNKAVEKTSDALGSTLFRPNAMLSGSIVAFISITSLYFVFKYYGIQPSSFEAIGAFVVGWVLGLLFDYAKIMFKKN